MFLKRLATWFICIASYIFCPQENWDCNEEQCNAAQVALRFLFNYYYYCSKKFVQLCRFFYFLRTRHLILMESGYTSEK